MKFLDLEIKATGFVMLLLLFLMPSLGEASSMWLDPSSGILMEGQTYSLILHIADIQDPINVVATEITFTEESVSNIWFERGLQFNFWPTLEVDDNAVRLETMNLTAGVSGDIILGTLHFTAETTDPIDVSLQKIELHTFDGSGVEQDVRVVSARFNSQSEIDLKVDVAPSLELDEDVSPEIKISKDGEIVFGNKNIFQKISNGFQQWYQVEDSGLSDVYDNSDQGIFGHSRKGWWLWLVLLIAGVIFWRRNRNK